MDFPMMRTLSIVSNEYFHIKGFLDMLYGKEKAPQKEGL
jgi:hypothetical protein